MNKIIRYFLKKGVKNNLPEVSKALNGIKQTVIPKEFLKDFPVNDLHLIGATKKITI